MDLHNLLENWKIINISPEKMEVYDIFMKKLAGDILSYIEQNPEEPVNSIGRICDFVQRQLRSILVPIGKQLATHPE